MFLKKVGVLLGLAGLAVVSHAQYSVFAAESVAGSLGGNTGAYGGLQRYDFASTGGVANAGTGVPANQLFDPVGLRFHNGKLLVGNRVGNTQGQGKVQSFDWDGSNLSGGSVIATESSSAFAGFHGLAVSPTNGDLFVTTVNSGTRRYRDSGSGYVDIGGTSSGAVRDVLVSSDGTKLYETTLGGALQVTDILANGFGASSTFGVPNSGAMHQMTWRGGSIYVTSFTTSSVHRVDIDANFNPISATTVITGANSAIGIAFSVDGAEMYVSGHTTNNIMRYMDVAGTWTANGQIATNHNMGYLATVPEPGSIAALGLGFLALLNRRRKA